MRIIPILGLLLFFNSFLFDHSKIALLVMINGVLCHGFRDEERVPDALIKMVRVYDTLCNMAMVSYVMYTQPITQYYGMFSSGAFLIEKFLEEKKFSKDTIDILHVSTVQFPLSVGLRLALEN